MARSIRISREILLMLYKQLLLQAVHLEADRPRKTSNDDFANLRFFSLRHNTARLRELDQPFDGGEDSRDCQICVMPRIFGDVFVDGVKIAQRLWRPLKCALQSEAT